MVRNIFFYSVLLYNLLSVLSNSDYSNISFTSSTVGSNYFSPGFAVACGGFSQFAAPLSTSEKNKTSVNIESQNNDTLECTRLYNTTRDLKDNHIYLPAYDTVKRFVEHCAYIDGKAAAGFREASSIVQYISSNNERWIEFREWIKSVLYLNTTDPEYYCAAVDAILSTFNYIDPKRGHDINGALAVAKFIMDSHKCEDDNEDLGKRYANSRLQQYKLWQDTVKNPQLTPYDTTLPSLEELGLEILRGPEMAVKFTPNSFKAILGNLTVTNNPFSQETILTLTINQQAYIHFEVYDELGRIVLGDGGGSVLQAGKQQFRIQGSDLSKGTYYARISTLNGEVKTLKLRHIW